MIATNSVGQGNTRQTGLQHIVNVSDIELYHVTKNVIWPVIGAIVSTSIIHGIKGTWKNAKKYLDGEEASWINLELNNVMEAPDAKVLPSNENLSFQGTIVNCTKPGFIMTNAEAQAFFEKDSTYKNHIRPYIGGLDLNSSPTLQPSRYIIDFTGYSLDDVKSNHPDLFLNYKKMSIQSDKDKERNQIENCGGCMKHLDPIYIKPLTISRDACVARQRSKYLLFGFQPTDRVFS